MTPGPDAGSTGYIHEAALFGSEEELLRIVVPFLEEGRAAGQPTIVSFDERHAALVRDATGGGEAITFLDCRDQYLRPAAAIRAYAQRFAALVEEGASRIRVVGEVPHPGVGAAWDGWARYESVVNHAFAHLPLWAMCPYDTRVTPDEVLEDVMRTHGHVATGDGGNHGNDRYVEPRAFLEGRLRPAPDPLQLQLAAVDLANPTARDARQEVKRVGAGLSADLLDGLVTAVSEIVTNAIRHGIPPVRLQAWAGEGRVVVTVHDEGFGVEDPFAGLLPTQREPDQGGVGLWIAHQVCDDVSMTRGDDGFTVRMVTGERPDPGA